MNNIVKISNPMLVGAMALLKKKNSPENRKLFVDELLHAKLLTPVLITPPPVVDGNGNRKLSKESKMTFPMLKDKDDKRYISVFTDLNEMRQLKSDGYMTVIPVAFKGLAEMVAASEEACSGVAINPYGESVVLNRAYIETIAGSQKKQSAEAEAKSEDETEAEAVAEAKIEEQAEAASEAEV